MSTISRWVVPAYFSEENKKTEPIIFDLTEHLKLILKNEVWNRKFDYGYSLALKNTDFQDINSAKVKIFPRFFHGRVNEKRISELVEKECGKFPSHFKIKNYKDWSYQIGFAIIEVEYRQSTKKIPTKKDLTIDIIPHYEREFLGEYNRQLEVLKELSAFFLAGLHLSFPTTSIMMSDDNPVNDGFYQIISGNRQYISKVSTNVYMHEVLIETSKKSVVEVNLEGIASIWHYNLWSLKRYLSAVESDRVTMDNLSDLIYSLEGLFGHNTSSEFIKMTCILLNCKSKKEAIALKNLLNCAYSIRNEIAHGGYSYQPFEKVKLGGKDVLAQDVYWQVKSLVANMIIKAISKLIQNTDIKNLGFNFDDFINRIFK